MESVKQKILVTGAAGFIGFHVCSRLLEAGYFVVGIDNLNPYYDVALKKARIKRIREHSRFLFEVMDIVNREAIRLLFEQHGFTHVIHLAAQAGVRYSIENPYSYIDSNLLGFGNIVENCRQHQISHFLYASSSSVYGANTKIPFSEHDHVDHPVSLYAATKKANELMAHSYAHLYALPCTGLRFFTVYGPWGRPDMALFKFTKYILEDQPIEVYNQGQMVRDFTYISDIVTGIVSLLNRPAKTNEAWDSANPDPATSKAPYRIYNIGNHQPVQLMSFIEQLEIALNKKAKKKFLQLQPGDVPATAANVDELQKTTGFKPRTPIQEGIKQFVSWYLQDYLLLKNQDQVQVNITG